MKQANICRVFENLIAYYNAAIAHSAAFNAEENMVAVNGMSYSNRDSCNANTALIVNVTPDDFGDTSPLAGIEYQRKLIMGL